MKSFAAFAAVAALAVTGAAQASTISWATWTSATASSTAGSVAGHTGDVDITYSGEVENLFTAYPSWLPATSYTGGDVDNAPPPGIIQIFGGGTTVNTISFSHAVLNPVIAIWSLGQNGINARFDFTSPFTLVAGGPSAEYGGTSIVQSGNSVSGIEGNGVIQFNGSYTAISFTNPVFENWYGFTVGDTGVAVPEPATWGLMLLGFAGIGAGLRACRKARTMALADA